MAAARAGRSLVNSWISRRVTPGASSASPAATTRTASNSRSAVTSFSRNPLAPARSASKTYSSRSNVVRMRTLGWKAWQSAQPAGGLDAVHARHPNVHQHHVRPDLAADLDRGGAVGRGARHLEVRLGAEQRGEAAAHHVVVVGDHDPDRRGRHAALPDADGPATAGPAAWTGRLAWTRKPPPSAWPGAELAGGGLGALPHAHQAVPGRRPRPRAWRWPRLLAWRREPARPVVPHPHQQHVTRKPQLNVHRRAGRVPPGVGQRLLDDPVHGQLHAGVQRGHRAGDDQPDRGAGRVPALVQQLVELRQPRLRMTAAGATAGAERPSRPTRRPPGAPRAAGASRSARPAPCLRSRTAALPRPLAYRAPSAGPSACTDTIEM